MSCEYSCVMSLSPTGPEGFKHVLKFYANFLKLFQNISQECRATVVQVSRTCRQEILANLQCQIFRDTRNNVLRVSHDGCATVL